MKSIPFDVMSEEEYKEFLTNQAIEEALANPIAYVESRLAINRAASRVPEVSHDQVFEGVLKRSEEAALYYVNNRPVGKGLAKFYIPCMVWRSCADLLFPQLRRHFDDEVRNEILAHHPDYAVFATEAFKHDVDLVEVKGMLYALASNPDTIEIVVEYVRKNGHSAPWAYNEALARCAYTCEEWAFKLVKEFPKTLVFMSAARWHSLALKMVRSNKVEQSVKRSCVRFHADIAETFINGSHTDMLYTIFDKHPQLRPRILRRKDIDQIGILKRQIKDFHTFQNRMQQKSLVETLKAS